MNNWMKNPSCKQMILFTLLYFTGILLLGLSMTDLFTKSLSQRKYVLF